MRLVFSLLIALLLSACGTQMKVAEMDATGRLVSDKGTVTEASVLKSKPGSLARFNSSVYVSGGGEYGVNQMKATRLFQDVYGYEDLQRLVVSQGLQEQVPSVSEQIGLSRLAKAYKPYLWVHFKRVTRDNKPYLQMVASDPANLDELFVAEVHLDFVWAGVNDQNARYPLFNAFIAWARRNA